MYIFPGARDRCLKKRRTVGCAATSAFTAVEVVVVLRVRPAETRRVSRLVLDGGTTYFYTVHACK